MVNVMIQLARLKEIDRIYQNQFDMHLKFFINQFDLDEEQKMELALCFNQIVNSSLQKYVDILKNEEDLIFFKKKIKELECRRNRIIINNRLENHFEIATSGNNSNDKTQNFEL